jgi:hypothetical protein
MRTISGFRKDEYFCAEDWTPDSALNRLAHSDFARMRFCVTSGLESAGTSQKNATDLPDKSGQVFSDA